MLFKEYASRPDQDRVVYDDELFMIYGYKPTTVCWKPNYDYWCTVLGDPANGWHIGVTVISKNDLLNRYPGKHHIAMEESENDSDHQFFVFYDDPVLVEMHEKYPNCYLEMYIVLDDPASKHLIELAR